MIQCFPDSLRDETAATAEADVEKRPLATLAPACLGGHLGGGRVAAGGGGRQGSAESAQEEGDDAQSGAAVVRGGGAAEGGSASCGSAARFGRGGIGETEKSEGWAGVS